MEEVWTLIDEFPGLLPTGHPALLVDRALVDVPWAEWLEPWCGGRRTVLSLAGLIGGMRFERQPTHGAAVVWNDQIAKLVCFLLSMADGWFEINPRIAPVSVNPQLSADQQRAVHELAIVARQVLERELFRRPYPALIESMLTHPEVLSGLVRYFRVSGCGRWFRLMNLGTVGRSFVLAMCQLAIRREFVESDTVAALRLEAAQPDYIDMLGGLNELELLLSDRYFEYILPASWVQMHKLALRPDPSVPDWPNTVTGAMSCGSRPARALALLRMKRAWVRQ